MVFNQIIYRSVKYACSQTGEINFWIIGSTVHYTTKLNLFHYLILCLNKPTFYNIDITFKGTWSISLPRPLVTASLCLFQDDRFSPAKSKISKSHAQDDGKAQPRVVSHEDEHKEIAEEQLYHMQEGLNQVELAPHVRFQGLDPLLYLGRLGILV